jgi:hypothetical protein
MVSGPHLNVLRQIIARLDRWEAGENRVNWALTGSLSFALQGLPVEPHDIDLQTDRAGAYAVERCFAEAVIRPVAFSAAANIRSHFGALCIDGITVEIMGDIEKRLPDGSWEGPVDLARHRRFVDVEGLRVPVLSLAYERDAYLKLGRVERAALLAEWIAAHGPDTGG